jgi:hypothetical protein
MLLLRFGTVDVVPANVLRFGALAMAEVSSVCGTRIVGLMVVPVGVAAVYAVMFAVVLLAIAAVSEGATVEDAVEQVEEWEGVGTNCNRLD